MRGDLHSWLRDTPVEEWAERLAGERALLAYGRTVGWDREAMITFCLSGPSGWLGREVFEASYDSGAMRTMAKVYCEEGARQGV